MEDQKLTSFIRLGIHLRRRVVTFCVRSAVAPASAEVLELERGDERRDFGGLSTSAHVPKHPGLTGTGEGRRGRRGRRRERRGRRRRRDDAAQSRGA